MSNAGITTSGHLKSIIEAGYDPEEWASLVRQANQVWAKETAVLQKVLKQTTVKK